MPTPRLHRLRHRTLVRALEILGDERALARALRVPALDLNSWLEGNDTPPTAVFLSAVDIVDSGLALDRFRRQDGDAGASLGG